MRSLLLLSVLTLLSVSTLYAQEFDPEKEYVIIKTDGTQLRGKILSSDAREVLMQTTTIGQVIIPKHVIQSIREFNEKTDTGYKEVFASRYFISTNGLPVEKGDSYVQYLLLGPDIQFGVAENLGIGLITTWFASPVLGTVKYTKTLSEDVHLALGGILGGEIWSLGQSFYAGLPFAALTFG